MMRSDIPVAMGILGDRTSELFLPGPDILPPALKTGNRLLQIETQKGRLRRSVHQHRRDDIYPRPHLQRRILIPLVIPDSHCPSCPRRRSISSLHRHRMEIRGPSDLTTPTVQTSVIVLTRLDLISRGSILLCQYILSADLFSSGAKSSCWAAAQFGAITGIASAADCDCPGGWIRGSKVSPLLRYSSNLEWGAIILYYGWGMEFM